MRTKGVPVKSYVPFVAVALALAPLSAAAQSAIEQKIDALQQEVERLKQESRARKEQAPAAASDSATSIFGYGEFNYNRFRDPDRTSKADLRRFVIGFGHRFNDALSFNSELELEHGVVSADDHGEVEIEQAYLN